MLMLYNLHNFSMDRVLGIDVPDSYRDISKCVDSITSSWEYPCSIRSCCIRSIKSLWKIRSLYFGALVRITMQIKEAMIVFIHVISHVFKYFTYICILER